MTDIEQIVSLKKHLSDANDLRDSLMTSLDVVHDKNERMREALGRKAAALKIANEDVKQYQNVLTDMASELCAAMGCDVEKYETDQAEYECYRDCFRGAAKQLATMREALERIIGSVGDNGIEARNKARVALERMLHRLRNK